jgi:hypothetical protein
VPLTADKFLALSIQLLAFHNPINRRIMAASLSAAQTRCEFLFVTLDLLFKQSESGQEL